MINYIELFSGDILNIVPELTKGCAKDSVWHVLSDFIRFNHSQDMIKTSYLLILDEFGKIKKNDIDNTLDDKYLVYMDILWHALSDENCAKIELHVRNDNCNS